MCEAVTSVIPSRVLDDFIVLRGKIVWADQVVLMLFKSSDYYVVAVVSV